MTKYKIFAPSPYSVTPQITEVECVRETEHSVWLPDGSRESKTSGYELFFDTWDEAYQALFEAANLNCARAERELDRKQKDFQQILDMRREP